MCIFKETNSDEGCGKNGWYVCGYKHCSVCVCREHFNLDIIQDIGEMYKNDDVIGDWRTFAMQDIGRGIGTL